MPTGEKASISFNAGEWSPRLDARQDLEKASSAMRVCKNMIVLRHGGVKRRAGLKYVSTVMPVPFWTLFSQGYSAVGGGDSTDIGDWQLFDQV